jgi:hypothetical protein
MSFIITVIDDSDKQHAIEVANTDTILNLKLRCGFTASKQMFYNGHELANDATIYSSEIVRSAKIWCPSKPSRSLCIVGDHETVLHVFQTETIGDVKIRYKALCGAPLFRQKWVSDAGNLLEDDCLISEIADVSKVFCIMNQPLGRILPWSATANKHEDTTLDLF